MYLHRGIITTQHTPYINIYIYIKYTSIIGSQHFAKQTARAI